MTVQRYEMPVANEYQKVGVQQRDRRMSREVMWLLRISC